MLVTMAARGWLLFGTDYVPGVNGAYYLVQARSLLDRGVLGIPDLPFTFHLHAAWGWLLAAKGGMVKGDAITRAMKLCYALLPPLVASPLFVLVKRWATSLGRGGAAPVAIACLSCFAWPGSGWLASCRRTPSR
jgi:hypothetical protein